MSAWQQAVDVALDRLSPLVSAAAMFTEDGIRVATTSWCPLQGSDGQSVIDAFNSDDPEKPLTILKREFWILSRDGDEIQVESEFTYIMAVKAQNGGVVVGIFRDESNLSLAKSHLSTWQICYKSVGLATGRETVCERGGGLDFDGLRGRRIALAGELAGGPASEWLWTDSGHSSPTMAPASSKRVKSTKITRPFLIGNEAHILPHPSFPNPAPEGHTKGWKVYVRPLPNGPDITTWLKKVQFKLHHTYADASRTIEAPGPFEVTETGYGEFGVEIRLYFAPESGEKAVYREHYLVLAPYGSEEQRAKQEKENMIVAERMEIVEFNEPTVDFFKMLVSEEQWHWLMTKRGRGKGKKAEMVFEGDTEPTVVLPERGKEERKGGLGAGGAWSLLYERQTVGQLKEAEKVLVSMLEEERKAMEQRRKRMEELGVQIAAK